MPGFSDAAHLLVRGASHDDELWLGNPAIRESIADFLAGRQVQSAELDVPPPVFATSKFNLLLQELGIGWGAALAILMGLAMLPVMVVMLWRRRRRRRRMAS